MSESSVDQYEKKNKVARQSLTAAVIITLIKVVAAYASGSLGVLSDVFNSGIDIFVAVVTIISVRYSSKPPDEDHNYGHEKIESFSALFQVFILFITSAYIIFEAIQRLFIRPDVELNVSIWIILALVVSMVIDYYRAKALKQVAKETNSRALEADALHFSVDILSSSIVIAGLILTYLGVSKIADTIAALAVTGIILKLGFDLARKSFDSLMDRVPEGLYEKLRYETLLVNGVEGIKNIRIRNAGSVNFIDMTIEISRLVPFSKAHDIMDSVERNVREIVPNSDVVIHSEPVITKNETINDKIRMIVSEAGFKCHDIFSHRIDNEIYSELHVEIGHTNDLYAAHNSITELEKQIKEQIDVISHLKIHIDEPSDIVYDTRDITANSNEIIREVRSILEDCTDVLSSSEIQVVSTNGRIRVSMNCVFRDDYSFDEVHDIVTTLESRIFLNLKNNYPRLANVMIHAEPSEKL
ncbi:MAG: cation-efflux pump [Ignavibacteria bacterium]|nr:cation-efflux pump [Ignavibacteria bacterium]